MKSNYNPIGNYIDLVDDRNSNLKVSNLVGLTVNKNFIPSVANTIGTNMANYKIIRRGQFACSLMQVRRDKKIPVALMTEYDEAIISQAYPVFKIKDEVELLPEYLMMWMSRSEFDREACFYAVGGVRGSLEWEDFCNMSLPVPHIEKQREIVREYHSIVDRITLNEELNRKLEETAQTIYRYWFVDFEFPISHEYAEAIGKPELEGKPYNSSGGEMEFNEELEKDIPKAWKIDSLGSIASYNSERRKVSDLDLSNYISTENMIAERGGVKDATGLPTAKTVGNFSTGDILISNIRPYFKKIWLAEFSGGCSNDVLCLCSKSMVSPLFLYFTLETDAFFEYVMQGAKGTKMPRGDKDWIMKYLVVTPSIDIMKEFTEHSEKLSSYKIQLIKSSCLATTLLETLLSKMTKVGS